MVLLLTAIAFLISSGEFRVIDQGDQVLYTPKDRVKDPQASPIAVQFMLPVAVKDLVSIVLDQYSHGLIHLWYSLVLFTDAKYLASPVPQVKKKIVVISLITPTWLR